MSIKAGTTITTAHLSHTAPGVVLSAHTLTATGVWEQWGTETITIPNPGVAIEISAMSTGRWNNSTDATAVATPRVLISLDGGSTFTAGDPKWGSFGTSYGVWLPMAASHIAAGTPTGDIVIKAEVRGDSLNTSALNGLLTATMIPAA